MRIGPSFRKERSDRDTGLGVRRRDRSDLPQIEQTRVGKDEGWKGGENGKEERREKGTEGRSERKRERTREEDREKP